MARAAAGSAGASGLPRREGTVAEVAQTDDVFGGANAAFSHHKNACGHAEGQLFEEFDADSEASQIAAVDADQRKAEVNGAPHLPTVVSLAENVQSERMSFVAEIAEGRVGVSGDDEQDRVGSEGAGFEYLKGVKG